ncbi:hypothetical protein PRZ48_014348 [Zasmidium cellare]|uniref:Uncharacterized protein n=1 Tax=Zasmidium cellare TaxID=395010 RepID=A0ABR0E0P4_ZASCE|nr:hypothetical protein PRZ48_015298 [Zasmidium cellare]KAK4494992.1 hypothetical protein PRZ48_014348 [Zasmidium cellare]
MSSTKNTLHRAFGIDAAAHGDLTGTTLDSDADKYQSVDLFRSRARNEAFMEINKKLLDRIWQAGDPVLCARLRDLMRGYRSSTDNPLCFLPDEVYYLPS